MKIIILLFLLTGCAGFKATTQHTNTSKMQEQRVYDNVQTQQVKRSFNLLEQQWQQDSVTYKALILTEGPYRLNTDSGISGTGARIWVAGSRQKWSLSQKQQDSSRTDSLATHIQLKQEHKQQEQQTVKSTRQFSLNLYWVLLSIGLLILAVYFVRKYWPKSPG